MAKRRQRSGAAIYRPWWVPWLWVAAPVAAAVVFGIFPFVNTVILSFTNAKPLGGASRNVGWHNYTEMFGDPDFWTATKNSVEYAVLVVPLMVLLPLMLAVLVHKKIPGIGFFRTAFYTPVLASIIVVGFSWSWMLGENGMINTLLQDVHLIHQPIQFLTDPHLLLFSAMAMTVWKGLGWYMVIYLAALGNVPKELYEAAEMDGAGAVRKFFSITVPGVRLTMAIVGTLTAIGSLRVFTEIFILGGPTGGPGGQARTLPFYIRDAALDPETGNLGYGSAISVALFVLTVGLTLLGLRLSRGKEDTI
jgi:multiple sugar transport system permease protein